MSRYWTIFRREPFSAQVDESLRDPDTLSIVVNGVIRELGSRRRRIKPRDGVLLRVSIAKREEPRCEWTFRPLSSVFRLSSTAFRFSDPSAFFLSIFTLLSFSVNVLRDATSNLSRRDVVISQQKSSIARYVSWRYRNFVIIAKG